MPDEPVITEPPTDIVAELGPFGAALDGAIPAKQLDRNLLVATWNLRAFGDLTKKWRSGPDDSPKRDFRSLLFVAEVVSRFDVVALQEVRGNLRAFRHMLRWLGPEWGFTLTDVTKGARGNDERMAFVFDTRRVKPSGLACELVVPVEEDAATIKPDAFNRQFARSPYAVSFVSAGKTFILVTLHVLYGDEGERAGELTAIAEWLAGWAEREEGWDHNLIALGDFNITGRENDPLLAAFTSTGLRPAEKLNEVPRTIFDNAKKQSFYDQIAWFTDAQQGPLLSLTCTGAGSFDFVPLLLGDLTKTELSWRISDHYPLWVEFSVREHET